MLKLAATALALAYAGAAVLMGQPRLNDPASEARAALVLGDPAVAQVAASRLVAAEPMNGQRLGLLGAARLASGDAAGADAAYRASAEAGWRDAGTQAYWLSRAQDRGDWRQAALRLDALLRTDPQMKNMQNLLAPFEASVEGREALAQTIARPSPWRARYLRALGEISDAQLLARAQVVTETGRALACEDVAMLIGRLEERGSAPTARTLRERHCADPA